MIKKALFGSGSGFFFDLSMLALRVTAGLMMALLHGLGKLPPSERFIAGVAEIGFPMPIFFAWSASIAEFAGGLLLAIGLFTRPAAFFVGFTMAVAAFGRHLHDPFDKKELSLIYLAVALVFFAYGSGRWGLDKFFAGAGSKRKSSR